MSTVSVVIPTYQRRDAVLRAVRALADQTHRADAFEVVVSVDGSTDGTAEAVRALATPFSLTVLDGPNRGRAAACNVGISAASGDLLVLLDDDMEPSPSFLEAHVGAHGVRTGLGVMGAAPVRHDSKASPATRYVGAKFNRHLEMLALSGRPPGPRDFYSGNFSIARTTLLAVGGFDEDFRRYGNEDLELSVRLGRAGVQIVYDPAALAYQRNDKSFATLAADNEAKGRTAVLFATKHPEVFAGLKLGSYRQAPIPVRALRTGLLGLGRTWPGFSASVVRLESWLSAPHPPGLSTFYSLALGYFYWMGARSALREQGAAVQAVPALARLAEDLRA